MHDTLNSKTQSLLINYGYYLLAVIGSLGFSCLALYSQQPFNMDGIRYLDTATVFLQSGIHAAMNVYPWPFYSVLIAITSKIMHLSLEHSAFLINALLDVIIIVAFISLVKELGGQRRALFFGTLLILIYPFLNHDRTNILRDFGYYAFALFSLLYFIRFLRTPNWNFALSWGLSIIVATLFRIEGIVILLLAPFAVFLLFKLSIGTRITAFLKIQTINILGGITFLIWLAIKKQSGTVYLGRLSEPFFYLQQGFSQIINNFQHKSVLLTQTFYSDGLSHPVSAFLLTGLMGVFIQSLMSTLGIFSLALTYHALRYRLIPADTITFLGWLTYVCLNILIICFFLMNQFFLSERYIVLLCLLLLLCAPFSLTVIYNNWQQQKICFTGKKWFFPLSCIFLGAMLINSVVHFGVSKSYIVQTGNWINKNTPQSSRVLSNDMRVFYYCHREGEQNSPITFSDDNIVTNLQKITLKNFNYLTLVIPHDKTATEQQVLAFLQTKPLKEFHNRRGDKALIIKLGQ